MRDLPLADLEVFVAVAECEGFSAAARRLAVSKAMVSVAIGRLESRLRVRLLHRTTRKLSLTEAGTAMLPHAQRSILAARDAAEAATLGLTSPRGVLRINAPMSFGVAHVAPALGAFTQAYPEIRVDLALDDRVVDLVQGASDLAIRVGTLADSALVAQRLARSTNVLVASPAYLARHGEPRSPVELGEHAALLYALSPTGARWELARGSRTTTVRMDARLQANSSLALHHAVREGLGIARMPMFIVGPDLAAKRLKRVLADWSFVDQGIYAVTATRDAPRKTRAFIDFFKDWIGEPPYWERGHERPPTR